MPTPPVIALTGSIATGKSTAALHLKKRGAALIDADAIAHDIYSSNPDLVARIVNTFGSDILDEHGVIDRAALGERIFASPPLRELLNSLTHPYIRKQMLVEHTAAMHAAPPLIVHDIPLLFESSLADFFPRVLVIAAPQSIQLERLVTGRHLTIEEARNRISAQLPSDMKCRKATWCCENTGTISALEARLDDLWPAFVDDGPQPRLDLLTTNA